jgi:hypothetical protein
MLIKYWDHRSSMGHMALFMICTFYRVIFSKGAKLLK